MFCTRCGTQNPDDAGFCRNCSSALTRPVSQHQSGTYANPQSYAPQQTSQSPYPGYQGPPSYRSEYANQSIQQQSASGRAIASMVLSILGLVMCTFFTTIPGMILGKMEMNAIAAGQAPRAGETLAKIGFYVGIAGTVIYCLGGIAAAMLGMLGSFFNAIQ